MRFWCRLGWISFGGPTGQIALMHRELVERRAWIEEKRFLNALNYCLMLPGPEAQQLATYLGWMLHGARGGLAAGILFVLPGACVLWALSVVYVYYGALPWLAAAFHGLVPAVIAIVFHALWKLGRKTLVEIKLWIIAVAAVVLTAAIPNSYPAVVLGTGVTGWFFRSKEETSPDSISRAPRFDLRSPVLVALACLAAWLAPLGTAVAVLGRHDTITQEGIFFSKAALVTFGGAYAILPYVGQHAVQDYHWLSAEQMLHGYGLAETTPGPLIIILQFVGFMGAWHQPGPLSPLLAATLGSMLTTWVTFAPSFLYILAGAPMAERLMQIRALQSAVRAISAAVVGVMARFALWFAGQAILFHGAQPDYFVLVVSILAFVLLQIVEVDALILIAGCAALGVLAHLI